MDLNILKNPIVLTIIASALTYLYLWWENKKLKEKNPKAKIEDVSYITPIIVGLLTLFITYNMFGFDNKEHSTGTTIIEEIKEIKEIKQGGGSNLIELGKNKLSEGMTDTFGSNTYHLVSKNNIKLPQTDVFIDIARF